ncbi:MAG: hypothetical protein AAF628_18555 [Planctomycetota bacterium]
MILPLVQHEREPAGRVALRHGVAQRHVGVRDRRAAGVADHTAQRADARRGDLDPQVGQVVGG